MSRGGGFLVAAATAVVILAAAIAPFLTPAWIGFEQDRAEAQAWTGWSAEEVRAATDAIVSDLLFGGDFDVEVRGQAVLSGREQSHMAAVRDVFWGFALLAIVAIGLLAAAWRRSRTAAPPWPAIRRGALVLAGALAAAGLLVAFAFDAAFAIFHALLFSAGSWTFDPRTERLVQLFPERFWVDTATAVGLVGFGLALLVARATGRRAAAVGD